MATLQQIAAIGVFTSALVASAYVFGWALGRARVHEVLASLWRGDR